MRHRLVRGIFTRTASLGDTAMKTLSAAILGLTLALGLSPVHAAESRSTTERKLLGASQAVLDAQLRFDLKALDALLAPDYVEVSPIGDVDERAEVLGFYTPQARAQMLAGGMEPLSVKLDQARVRVYGDQAIVIARDTATLRIKDASQQVGMRVLFHFRKLGGKWLLQSSQFTSLKLAPAPTG